MCDREGSTWTTRIRYVDLIILVFASQADYGQCARVVSLSLRAALSR